jgi:hypothetical protein
MRLDCLPENFPAQRSELVVVIVSDLASQGDDPPSLAFAAYAA